MALGSTTNLSAQHCAGNVSHSNFIKYLTFLTSVKLNRGPTTLIFHGFPVCGNTGGLYVARTQKINLLASPVTEFCFAGVFLSVGMAVPSLTNTAEGGFNCNSRH